MPKRKPANYYNQTCRELEHVTPPTKSKSETDKCLPSYSSDSSNWEFGSLGVVFKNLFANMTSISQVKTLSHSTPFHGPNNLIFNERSISNNANLLLRIR